MTDKEKLEKAVKLADAMYYAAQYLTTDASRLRRAMDAYHQFIITEYHKQEPTSEDLEQAANAYIGYAPDIDESSSVYGERLAFKAGAKWQKEQNKFKSGKERVKGYRDGFKDCKEQMMKDAIECKVYQTEVEGIKLDSVEICSDGLMLDKKKYKAGDKVKVIIIKD